MTARSTASAVLAAVVPVAVLVFDPAGWRPFGAAKWGILVVVAVAGVAAAALAARPASLHRASAIAWVALLGVVALAALLGVDPLYAWIGAPGRHLGVLTWVLLAASFWAAQVAWRGGDARPLLVGAIVAGLGIGAYTLAEIVGAEPVAIAESSGRLTGPFGSAAYLGAATVLLAPILLGAALDRCRTRAVRSLATIAGAATLVALVGSQTRGAMIGLVAGCVAAAFGARRWIASHRRQAVVGAVALVLVGGLVLAWSPAGERVGDAADGAGDRLDEWRVGAVAVTQRPLIGSGPEGYRIVFAEAVDAGYERRHGRDVVPDRTHNAVLELGVVAGVPGMVAWLALLATLVRPLGRALRSGGAVPVGMASGAVAYVVQQQFLFPLAEVDPAFWLVAGALVAAFTEPSERIDVDVPLVVPVAVAVAGGAAVVAATAGVAADRSAGAAVDALAAGDAAGADERIDRAADLRPDDLRLHLQAALVDRAPTPSLAGIDRALADVDAALDLSPRDPVASRTRAELLTERSSVTGEVSDVEAALGTWQELVDHDPNNATLHMGLAAISDRAGDTSAAERHWTVAADLAPHDPFPSVELARLAIADGEAAEARRHLTDALGRDADALDARRLLDEIDALEASGRT